MTTHPLSGIRTAGLTALAYIVEHPGCSSISIREWAEAAGGAVLEWECGEGDARLRGWRGADGTRAIETNGDPIWSEDASLACPFDHYWDSRALDCGEY